MNVFGPAVVILGFFCTTAGLAQDARDGAPAASAGGDGGGEAAESDESAAAAEPPGESLESCFNADGLIDVSVLNDAHLYVRTRGNNSYLVRTELCEGLERSYLRRTAWLVPFGREVCGNDGSHVVYATGGQDRVCPVRGVVLVTDRAQASQIAAGNDPVVIFEELPIE